MVSFMVNMTIPEKIRQALTHFNTSTSNRQVTQYIMEHWPRTNLKSIRASLITLTVNHDSRIHYEVNKNPRLTNTGSSYDLLFRTERGQLEKYDVHTHGIWEIKEDENGRLSIQLANSPVTYTPGDIKWIKNVTNREVGQAYMNIVGDHFVLHFPTKHRQNVLSPGINELIVLYQKIDDFRVLTHLVTPVDNVIVEDPARPRYLYGRKVKIIAITGIDSAIEMQDTAWSSIRLSGVSQGNVCNIANIFNVNNLDALQMDTWNHFTEFFTGGSKDLVAATNAIIKELKDIDPGFSVMEGAPRLVKHILKERKTSIVIKKKNLALKANKFFCEVCTFSFPQVYQSNYIECHHITPISDPEVQERPTTLEDLVLVCSNCHRMLHTKIKGRFLTVEELREHIISGPAKTGQQVL